MELTDDAQIHIIVEMEKIWIQNHFLDEEQMLAATSLSKYSMIVAGAGAGKTTTILGKIKYLVRNGYYKPEDFCCISFTNEAVRSLKNKLFEVCGAGIDTFTFHKLAVEVLKKGRVFFEPCSQDLLHYIIDEFFASKCFGNKFLQDIVFFYFGYFFKTDKNWKKILQSPRLVQFKKLIITFISLIRCNPSMSMAELIQKYVSKYRILYVFYAIFLCYESEKQSVGSLDFDDFIIKATSLLKKPEFSLPYHFYVIDEFQDTSDIRFNFIQALLSLNDAALCVVGDDFQSIYHFSGCDLHLFLNFKTFFPDASMFSILNTYRNSQQLIDVAGDFVQKNPFQIQKALHSPKSISYPIKIVYYQNPQKAFLTILKKIDPNESIFILGRNHFSLKAYLSSYTLGPENELIIPGVEHHFVRFLTIHSSKGLECDVVILLDVEDGIFGIPSLIKDESVLNLVKKSESFPFEEERRLFYVALTRAKKYVYLMTPKKNPSRFIREVKSSPNVETIHLL